jgi:uncharacterized protein YdaU (DUF1376 family)
VSKSTPSFAFYPQDWLVGTARLSLRARGLLITLLAQSWCQGAAALPAPDTPAHITELCRLTGLTRAEWRRIWPEVADKFQTRADGRLVNAKLEAIRERGEEYRARQAAASAKGGAATKAIWQQIRRTPRPTGGKLGRMKEAHDEFAKRRRP